ncbi:MAG: SGNH/GDSL hydrolase family protein [Chitinophagaceae bacterium]|nr:SGNH/GDSL hydrolase family protein [Chitinophagaceae bacterium]
MTKNKVAYLIFRIVLLMFIIAALDFTSGKILEYYYFKQNSGLQYRTTYSMDTAKTDILVFGSSRANHHYVPEFFGGDTMSFYNTGRDANYILYNTAVLKSVLKRYTPTLVILDFDVTYLNKRQENYDRLSSLLPYYKSHEEIREIVETRSPYEKIKLMSYTYPFNSMILTIAAGNMETNKERKQDDRGYVAFRGKWPKDLDTMVFREVIDDTLVRAFESFVTSAKNAGSQLVVVVSPLFYKYEQTKSIEIAKQVCEKHGVQFLDYSHDSTFLSDRNLFDDLAHMNDDGARIFSKMLSKKLIVKKKTGL